MLSTHYRIIFLLLCMAAPLIYSHLWDVANVDADFMGRYVVVLFYIPMIGFIIYTFALICWARGFKHSRHTRLMFWIGALTILLPAFATAAFVLPFATAALVLILLPPFAIAAFLLMK